MRALDTNPLIRFLVDDDHDQSAKIRKILKDAEKRGEQLFLPQPVILECIWVLGSVYGFDKKQIITALLAVLSMPIFEIDNRDILNELCTIGPSHPCGLADLFIGLLSKSRGCDTVLTFDKKAAKSPYFQLI